MYVAVIEHDVEGGWHFTCKMMYLTAYEGHVERLDIMRHWCYFLSFIIGPQNVNFFNYFS